MMMILKYCRLQIMMREDQSFRLKFSDIDWFVRMYAGGSRQTCWVMEEKKLLSRYNFDPETHK